MYNVWIREFSDLSVSTNKTPTPFEPLRVFKIIGNFVSRFSKLFSNSSGDGHTTVFGCSNPKSFILKYVLISIVSQLKLSSNIAIANCNLAKKVAKKAKRITFEILLSQVMKDGR